MDELLVYVSVSNTDQKLTLVQWSDMVAEVELEIERVASSLFLNWFSLPNGERQGAVWAFKMPSGHREGLRARLDWLRRKYGQDEMTWAEGVEDSIR
jgi:hypothetical protein